MCVTRVGQVVSTKDGRALVRLFDNNTLNNVDVSMVKVKSGEFVEVFANLAMSRLTPREAQRRREAWAEIKKAAMVSQ